MSDTPQEANRQAPAKIVVVEDDPDILELIQYNLARQGYDIVTCRDGEEGLLRARGEQPDLVLLDLMLPGLGGLEICKRLKANAETRSIPVIIVSAKGEESDIVVGLDYGAEDYVTKPFGPRELLARVRAALRRSPMEAEQNSGETIVRDGLMIDPGAHRLLVDGKPVSLTATEMRLLHFLASNSGRVFSRDQLISNAIGGDAAVIDRNIDVHIGALRRKIGPYRNLIETLRGLGYRFIES